MQRPSLSKGVRETVRRAAILPARYGFRPNRIAGRVERMVALMDRWESRPTLAVTASVLDRHPSVISCLNGVDLAIHGYYHRSYADMTIEEQAADLDGAISAFGRRGLITEGFRAPYLGTNPDTFRLLKSRRFVYDSSWPVFCLPEGSPASRRAQNLATKRYGRMKPLSLSADYALPLTELPVALPDDEILVDGLGVRSPSTLARILGAMVEWAKGSAGHLILQVHPERFDILSNALDLILRRATDEGAWKASLSEAAAWILKEGGVPGHWPSGRPYAVSVTGDLDALSLGDFTGRIWVT